MNLLAVFVGGGLGSLARYGLSVFVSANWGNRLPWATLGANALSCVVFGLALVWLAARPQLPDAYRLFLLVGFCGGFSTFSTFSFETLELFRSGQFLFGLANVLISVCLCVLILFTFAKRLSHELSLSFCTTVGRFRNRFATSPKPDPPKLVVGILVDQMRNEYLDRYWGHFSDGGFKRLVGQGFYCRNAHYNYIPTFTGPGHASVYTGTTPATHGIVANSWYDPVADAMRYCAFDENTTGVGSDAPAASRSPHALLATTFTDELRIASQMQSKVVGVSIKDRSAIFPAGHRPNGAYWFDSSSGHFISSSWYAEKLPDWVKKFNGRKLPKKYLSKPWKTLLPIKEYDESMPDDNPYEGLIPGEKKPVFPHNLPGLFKQNGFGLVSATPFGNTLVSEMAMAAVSGEELGKDEFPDVLAVSYSSTDIIGHRYGPGAIETQDAYLRLDRELENLLNFLDAEVGAGQYAVFITADHGGNEVPSYLKDQGMPGDYFDESGLKTELNKQLNEAHGEGNWVLNVSNEQVFLNKKLAVEKDVELEDLAEETATMAMGFPGISTAFPYSELPQGHPEFSKDVLLTNGYFPARSGQVLLQLLPGWMQYGPRGTTHGSGYNYDTHVPIIFFGKQVPQGESFNYTPITAIAPTVSFLLGAPLPNGSQLAPVQEILNRSKR